MSCFKKTLSIRQSHFRGNENHESIADCHYNIAVIQKQKNQTIQALNSLNISLRIRAKLIGEVSLPIAQVN